MISLTKYQMQDVELSQIDGEDRQFQCRQVSDADVKAMAETLKKEKQKVPIYLLRRKNGKQQILCGFTRYLAAKLLGWATIVAIMIPEEDFENENEIYKFGVIENGKRKPLSNVDKGNICKSMSAKAMNNVEIGECLGISEKQVRRYLKIANAPAEVQKGMSDNSVPLRAIDNIDPATGQLGTRAEQIVDNPNCYVKPVKSGFKAVLNYREGKDKDDVVKSFKAKIDAELAKLQKARAEADKEAAQKAAEADKKANEARATKLAEDIKVLESAAKTMEKDKQDSSAIRQQIENKKAELKALKARPVRNTSTIVPGKSNEGPADQGQPISNGASAKPNKNPSPEQLAQLKKFKEGGQAAVEAGLEAQLAQMKLGLNSPNITDAQKAGLNMSIQMLQSQLDALKKGNHPQPGNNTPQTPSPHVRGETLGLEGQPNGPEKEEGGPASSAGMDEGDTVQSGQRAGEPVRQSPSGGGGVPAAEQNTGGHTTHVFGDFSKLEARIAELEKESVDPAKTDEERSAKKAELEESKASLADIKKFLGS